MSDHNDNDDVDLEEDIERTIALLERDDVIGFHAEIYRRDGMTTAASWTDEATEEQGGDGSVAAALLAHHAIAVGEEVDEFDSLEDVLWSVRMTALINPWEPDVMPDRAVDIEIEGEDDDDE